jgi:hypothetical protein
LRTNISAVLSLSFVLAISTSTAYAQQAAPERKVSADQVADDTVQLMRLDIRSERKKIVAANLPLTEAKAVKFWPVYDRYVVEHSKIYDIRYALLKEYAQNYNTMTGEQANGFITLDCNRGTDGSTSLELDARIREGDLPKKHRHILPN